MLSEIATWDPRALTLLLSGVVVAVWLGLCCLFMLIRGATRWLLSHEPARPASLNRDVANPDLAARQEAGMAALLDIARPGCDCQYWDPEADRADWIPCGQHIDQLIKDLLA